MDIVVSRRLARFTLYRHADVRSRDAEKDRW